MVSASPSNVVVLFWVGKEEEVGLEVLLTVSLSKVVALAGCEVGAAVIDICVVGTAG